MTRLYLAGPMRASARSDFNFPAFDAGAVRLRAAGYEVFSPAEHDRQTVLADGRAVADLTIRECMLTDTAWICEHAEGVALLDGWSKSTGALAEVALARALGIQAVELEWWLILANDFPKTAFPYASSKA